MEYISGGSRDQSASKRVLERDRGICQCCGFLGKEVHHIKPVYLGGKAEDSNLITLCSECHRFAPNDEEDFLDYQKSGGAVWQRLAGNYLQEIAEDDPNACIGDLLKEVLEARRNVFTKAYSESIEPKARNRKKARRQTIEETLLVFFKNNPNKWYAVSEIHAELEDFFIKLGIERSSLLPYLRELVSKKILEHDEQFAPTFKRLRNVFMRRIENV